MSYITEFTIDGLSGRKDAYSCKLNRDVNVFFGLNGSGKTSLLKILQSAMENDTTTLQNVAFKSAEVKFYSVAAERVITRTLEQETIKSQPGRSVQLEQEAVFDEDTPYSESYINLYLEQKRRSELTWTTKPKLSAKLSGGFQHHYLPTSRLYIGNASLDGATSRSNHFSEQEIDLYFSRSLQRLWSAYSAEILTAVRQAQQDGLANILKAVLSPSHENDQEQTIDADVAFDRAAAFLQRQGSLNIIGSRKGFEQHYATDSQLRSVVSDINEVEQRIEEAMEPRVRLQSLIKQMFSGNKRVHFNDKSVDVVTDDNNPIGLFALSAGEKHLLRILIEALRAGESTAMIDEPEISLHIDWQRQLVEAMRHLNPQAQFILATHSPEIMADLDDDKIFRL